MILNKWILPTIGILLLLLASCTADDSATSNVKEGETIQMHFNLQPVKIESVSPLTTKATSGGNKALSVAMGLFGKESTGTTRSSTGVDEYAINEVCVFQFDGTLPTSTLVAKEYYASPDTTNLETTLTESSSDQTVYVVANVGDIISDYTIGTTTIADFQASTLGFATEASVTSGSDLPMIGSYTGLTMPGLYPVSLTRMVAKLSFICNVSLTNTSDAFMPTSVHLYSVPNIAQMSAPTGTYPANSITDASKYINYTAESYTAGNTLIWYIPENLRGTVSSITTEPDKIEANAPAYSTYFEVEGIYTPSGETAEYVTYRIYPGANMTASFDIARNTYYSISMTIKGMNEVDSRVLLPENLSMNNAGIQATANCYIVNDGDQAYKFKATVIGNGATTPSSIVSGTFNSTSYTQTAAAITPTTLSPTTALLLWETGSKGDVIKDGSVKLVGGYVRFKTANNSTNGNAVIAVTDGTNILWSWHIWKTTYAPNLDDASTYDTYVTHAIDNTVSGYTDYNSVSSRSFKMMKYNLGATEISNWSGTATNAGDLGLLYQWGRKDPFVGASGWTYVTDATTTSTIRIATANTTGYEWEDGSKSTRTDYAAAILNTDATISGYSGANATIEYARRHPTYYICGTSITYYDWLYATSRETQRDNLWGNPNTTVKTPNTEIGNKSIYDPCPVGWRVPPQDSFTEFTTTGLNIVSSSNPTVDFLVSGSFSNGWTFYTSAAKSATSFWPTSGHRNCGSGSLLYVSTGGYCWSSSSYSSGSMYGGYLGFSNASVTLLNSVSRAYGFPIRCVQE